MNMTKREKIGISLGALIGGGLLCGFAMTATLGEQLSAICIALGLAVSVSGFIFLVLALKKPTVKNK